MNNEISCGAVIFTRRSGKLRYVLIRSGKGEWGFAKGHMERGETEEETAVREIREETGLTVRLVDGFKETIHYPLPKKPAVLKQVHYFLAETQDPIIRIQPEEISDAGFFSYEEAAHYLTHDNLKQILTEADNTLRNRF